jgi:UDP-N-acetyl-D-mannosaminuronic acid dehydrogenase
VKIRTKSHIICTFATLINKEILNMKKVVFLGLGYIGLPTAAVAAAHGFEVIGVDVNPSVVETINQGKIHIVEPELGQVVRDVVQSGKLRAVCKPEAADAFLS